MTTLYLKDLDKVISVTAEHLEPVVPLKTDKVSRRTNREAYHQKNGVVCFFSKAKLIVSS